MILSSPAVAKTTFWSNNCSKMVDATRGGKVFRFACFFAAVLAIWFLSTTLAHADPGGLSSAGLFNVPDTDKSKTLILSRLFGGLVGGGSDPLVSLLSIFNQAALFLGGIIVAYTLVVGTAMSAHDGEVLGKKWSSFWVPIRTIIGTAFCLPVLKGGYCIAQAIVLWGALQGIGLADTLTAKFIGNVLDYQVSGVPVATTGSKEIGNIFVDLVCANAILDQKGSNLDATKNLIAPAGGAADTAIAKGYIKPTALAYMISGMSPATAGKADQLHQISNLQENGYLSEKGWPYWLFFPAKNNPTQGACGSASVALPSTIGKGASRQKEASLFDGSAMYLDVFKAQVANMPTIMKNLNALAVKYVKGDATDAEIKQGVRQASESWSSMSRNTAVASAKKNSNKQLIDSIKRDGWIMIGSWYMSIARAQQDLAGAASITPSVQSVVIKKSDKGWWASLWGNSQEDLVGTSLDDSVFNKIGKAQTLVSQASASTFQNAPSKAQKKDGGIAGWIVNKLVGKIMMPNGGIADQNPVVAATTLGLFFIGISTAFLITGFVVGTSALGNHVSAVVTSFISALAMAFGVCGLTLTYYIPMIPFILWIGAVFGWVVVLLEAMIAAPMWMVSHLNPEAEGMMGGARTGYSLFLSLVLRPPLMVIGFAAAVAVMVPLGSLLNSVFFGAFFSAVQPSMLGILSLVAGVVIYIIILQDLMKKVFGLIHEVPDHTLNWFISVGGGRLGQHAQQADQAVSGVSQAVVAGVGYQAMNQSMIQAGRGHREKVKAKGNLAAANREKESAAKKRDKAGKRLDNARANVSAKEKALDSAEQELSAAKNDVAEAKNGTPEQQYDAQSRLDNAQERVAKAQSDLNSARSEQGLAERDHRDAVNDEQAAGNRYDSAVQRAAAAGTSEGKIAKISQSSSASQQAKRFVAARKGRDLAKQNVSAKKSAHEKNVSASQSASENLKKANQRVTEAKQNYSDAKESGDPDAVSNAKGVLSAEMENRNQAASARDTAMEREASSAHELSAAKEKSNRAEKRFKEVDAVTPQGVKNMVSKHDSRKK